DAVLKQLNALRSGGEGATPSATPSPRQPAPAASPASKAPAALRETPSPPPPAKTVAERATPRFESKKSESPLTSAPTTLEASSTTAVASDDIEALWRQLVEAAGRASPFVKTYLLEAHPVSFDGR